MGVARFEELICWQLARELTQRVFELTRPTNVDVAFRQQIRSAASSVANNIAEGFGRRSRLEFARFLDIARGSLLEVQSLLYEAHDRNYLDRPALEELLVLVKRTNVATSRLQARVREFARQQS